VGSSLRPWTGVAERQVESVFGRPLAAEKTKARASRVGPSAVFFAARKQPSCGVRDTEVGPPERTRQTVREGLNDVLGERPIGPQPNFIEI